MTYKVMALDNVDLKAIQLLQAHPDIEIIAEGKLTRDQVLALIPEADAIIIRSATIADAELLRAATNLKILARAGVGVDNVDLEVATECGIVVVNTPSGNTVSTAEHAFGLMLALARHIPEGHTSLMEGRWARKDYMGVELCHKTLGLVGYGRIGQAVASRARAFEMTVIAYDPYISPDIAAKLGIQLVSLDTLLAQSDFISLHALVTEETREIINTATIAKMKDGVCIINAARGSLINDADLALAIRNGKVAGAALDVFTTEPPPTDNPLIGLRGVIHTPHLAASTSDAQVTVAVEAAGLIINGLIYHQFNNVCNPAILNA
ncbi:hypothetical protein MASR2M15_07220 [Anaerolineales bacterium]